MISLNNYTPYAMARQSSIHIFSKNIHAIFISVVLQAIRRRPFFPLAGTSALSIRGNGTGHKKSARLHPNRMEPRLTIFMPQELFPSADQAFAATARAR